MRLHIESLKIPEGAELNIDCPTSGVADGPFTDDGINGNGDVWSFTCEGNKICAHIFPGKSGKLSNGAASRISGYGYIPNLNEDEADDGDIRRRGLGVQGGNRRNLQHCNENSQCVDNASCTSASSVGGV